MRLTTNDDLKRIAITGGCLLALIVVIPITFLIFNHIATTQGCGWFARSVPAFQCAVQQETHR